MINNQNGRFMPHTHPGGPVAPKMVQIDREGRLESAGWPFQLLHVLKKYFVAAGQIKIGRKAHWNHTLATHVQSEWLSFGDFSNQTRVKVLPHISVPTSTNCKIMQRLYLVSWTSGNFVQRGLSALSRNLHPDKDDCHQLHTPLHTTQCHSLQ